MPLRFTSNFLNVALFTGAIPAGRILIKPGGESGTLAGRQFGAYLLMCLEPLVGLGAHRGQVAAASKGAVDSLTTGLALEVAAQGIRVNCVRPGLIYTDIHASGGEPGRVDRVKSALPMQRGGQPEEVAQAIVWLLSEKASYVTGSFIELAGGK